MELDTLLYPLLTNKNNPPILIYLYREASRFPLFCLLFSVVPLLLSAHPKNHKAFITKEIYFFHLEDSHINWGSVSFVIQAEISNCSQTSILAFLLRATEF